MVSRHSVALNFVLLVGVFGMSRYCEREQLFIDTQFIASVQLATPEPVSFATHFLFLTTQCVSTTAEFLFDYCFSQAGTSSSIMPTVVATKICVFLDLQGVEGASAAAHALSLPADAYGNDVSGRERIPWSSATMVLPCLE